MPPIHDIPFDMILEDHATFQKVVAKSGKKKSHLWDSVSSENTSISSVAPSDPESQALFEKANLRLKLSENNATFQKDVNKSGKKRSHLWDRVSLENTSISSVAPSDPESQTISEKAHLRLKLSENEKLIVILREQVIDTINRNALLAQQLKQAIASKCELVVVYGELESQKLSVEERFEKEYRKAHMKPLKERETRAQVEKNFMNELDRLLGEMNDMYRRHRNTVLEKDMEIALLHERICEEQWRRAN